MFECFVDAGIALHVEFVLPGRLVVFLFFGVPTGKVAVLEIEVLFDEKGRVGVLADIIGVELIVRQRVVNQPAQKSDVRPRANLNILIRHRRGAIEARVDAHQLGPCDAAWLP